MMTAAAKTASTIAIHLLVATGVGYALTGSLAVAGLVAVIEPVCAVIALHVHERAWARVLG